MTLLNDFNSVGKVTKGEIRTFLLLLNPVAPHITEEMWEVLGFDGMLNSSPWPKYEEEKTVENEIEMAVQINGKVRGTIVIAVDADKEKANEKAMADEGIKKYIEGKKIVKEIYIPGKIYNIVVKWL